MSATVRKLILSLLVLLIMLTAGMVITGVLSGSPAFLVAGMSGFGAVGGAAAALGQARRKKAAA